MNYAVIILSYIRPANLWRVVESVWDQHVKPERVLVWHNDPSILPVSCATNILSEANFGCPARHAMGLLCEQRRILFLDDDVILQDEDACGTMVEALGQYDLVGAAGRNVSICPDQPYTQGQEYQYVEHDVDIVKGWFCGVRREVLHHVFSLGVSPDTRGEDDICLSAAVRMATRQCGRVLEFHRNSFEFLRDANGNQNRPDHYARRDAACRELLTCGWKPKSWEAENG